MGESEQRMALREIASATAVVLSLVFVGLQVRQNTIAVRGATMQAISDASSAFMADMALDEEFAAIAARVTAGATWADFTPAENQQLVFNLFAFLRMLENTYLQHREGLVPDAVFESYGWNDGIIRTRYFADFWERGSGNVVSPGFREFFEARVHIGP